MATIQQDEADAVNVAEEPSLARNRSRRTKVDKTGRLAALQRLKQSKESGGKNKYEVKEELDVYEEVDEEEYSKIVRSRQEDDWIVDDDGGGYVEDGREIFDEEANEIGNSTSGSGKSSKSKKSKNPNIRAPGSQPKNIKSMFAAAAVKQPKKKPEKEVSLNDDALLGDLMSELHQGPSIPAIGPMKLKKKAPSYNPFASPVNRPKVSKPSKPAPVVKVSEPSHEPASSIEEEFHPKKETEDSMEIDEFQSQDLIDDLPPTQNIEEDLSQDSIDVSGLDFEEDFLPTSSQPQSPAPCSQPKSEPPKPKSDSQDSGFSSDFPDFSSAWESVKGEPMEIPEDVQVDSSKLPLTTNAEGEQVLRMYWLDAYEDQYKQPGVVYLFGKVWIESAKAHVSCCVAVKNIERRIYLLPRKSRMNMKTKESTDEPVTFVDVYQEFDDTVASKHKIMKFKSRKVMKQYAFEIADIPAESEYLEVQYPAEYPALPQDLQGATFSHVFGTTTPSLEILLIERRMKGPCWLDIKCPQVAHPPISWCKVEAFISKPDHVAVFTTSLPPPPLVVMAMNIRTLPNPKTHQNEVIGAACLVHHQFPVDKPAPNPPFQQHFCALGKPHDCIFPYDFKDQIAGSKGKSMKIEVMSSERALLGFLLAKINKIDPDIIVGHDVAGFDVDVLLHRLNHNKVPHWSRLGRLKKSTMPKLSNTHGGKGAPISSATSGRLICDVKISAKELLRCRSYDLTELVSQILKDKRNEIESDDLPSYYSNSAHLLELVQLILLDATFCLRMMYELNIMPLALQITNICGNVLARTLLGGRAERNEFLLNHAFTEKGFIVPDKRYGKKAPVVTHDHDDEVDQSVAESTGKKSSRRKPAYAGGLVLEPKKGFYDTFILLLDFNSLYPSIIQEFNICFTTISRENISEDDEEHELNVQIPDSDLEPGILPTEIRKLVQSRRQVKNMMKDPNLSPELRMQYDIRQKALKLTANSMYGCLGFSHSRFYAKPLAALVTAKGREILMKTKDLVQNMNLDVIYGDTDSIMVNSNSTDLEQVFKLGNRIKNEVNKLYRLLEIDIDGVFKSMLLLKKKKYAAINITLVGDKPVMTQELKGLDIVRRDWCQLATEAGQFVVSQILSGENRETILENIHSKLTDVGAEVKEGKIPVELYYITKSLTKNPEDYPDKKNLPHVQVALRLNSKGGRKLRSGDTVYYVICEDGSTLSASQRAYHPDELAKRNDLRIDTHYYLAQQVHPVVARLCDPIEGTDSARLAECLGLDPSGYRRASSNNNDEDDALLGGVQISDEERFMKCDRLKMKCPDCQREIIFDTPIAGMDDPLDKCPNPQCSYVPSHHANSIRITLIDAIREHIDKYYEGWLHCEDHGCGLRTRQVPLIFSKGSPVCPECCRGLMSPEYSDTMLYDQLCFYRHVFESKSNLLQSVDFFLDRCAYSKVNLSKLFNGLFLLK